MFQGAVLTISSKCKQPKGPPAVAWTRRSCGVRVSESCENEPTAAMGRAQMEPIYLSAKEVRGSESWSGTQHATSV